MAHDSIPPRKSLVAVRLLTAAPIVSVVAKLGGFNFNFRTGVKDACFRPHLTWATCCRVMADARSQPHEGVQYCHPLPQGRAHAPAPLRPARPARAARPP